MLLFDTSTWQQTNLISHVNFQNFPRQSRWLFTTKLSWPNRFTICIVSSRFIYYRTTFPDYFTRRTDQGINNSHPDKIWQHRYIALLWCNTYDAVVFFDFFLFRNLHQRHIGVNKYIMERTENKFYNLCPILLLFIHKIKFV